MPSRTTRSGRVIKNSSEKQAKWDALEILERQRRGEKVDTLIKEDEPLFDEVDEEVYRTTRKGGFVVGEEDDEDLSDSSFIDDNFEDDVRTSSKSKKGSKKESFIEHDPKQKSMRSFLGHGSKSKSTSYQVPSIPSSSKETKINEDDILSQMLFDVPTSRSSLVKPLKVKTSRPVVPEPLKTKSNYGPVGVKRPRMEAPSIPSIDPGCMSPWREDEDSFDDSFTVPEFIHRAYSMTTASKSNYELLVPDQESEQNNQFEDIKAVPLNEDLKSNLAFHQNEEDLVYTHAYWYDCCEDQVKYPGVVYFFARIYATTAKRYVSSCVIVKNIQRTIYLLISDDSTYEQVVGEFTHITAKKFKIKNFSCEKVTKKYSFSSDSSVPLLADYVKVEYPATQAALPSNLVGETFSKVLNADQTPMEKLILELKLRGPCWLRLIDPVTSTNQLTWTRVELVLESPKNLVVEEKTDDLKDPYFCTFSFSLRTHKNPTTQNNEIIAIAGMVNTTFNLDECLKRTNKASGHFLIMTKPPANQKERRLPYDFQATMLKYTRTRFELVETERDLLLAFMDKFNNLDPDIVVGHDLLNFDYETLVMRMKQNKVGIWSKLGRFKRTELPSTKAAFRYLFSGRVMCDIRVSAMELISARSYDLTELTSQVLQKECKEYNHSGIIDAFRSSNSLVKLLDATWENTDNIFSILVELNVIPLALKITNITGNILSRTLAAGRSERNEYLLLHAFHEENFICPDKQVSKFNKKGGTKANTAGDDSVANEAPEPSRRKPAYLGGLVLEPKAGYYDSCILLMDFNSLYPSIIQEYNICFSTVKIPNSSADEDDLIAEIPDEDVDVGVLPAQLKILVDRRRSIKRMMEDPNSANQKSILDIEQKALKLTANSMYGCLGFQQSRFYAKHLASLVTSKGREILWNTKAIVEKLGYEVVYGDTDSLMIDTKLLDYDEVLLKGNSIKYEVNRTFKLLEIDIDGVYRPLLLLKKKNYAGISIKKLPNGEFQKTTETKGLDTVRRDRAVIAKEAGQLILDMILKGDKDIDSTVEDIHNYLKELGVKMQSGQVANEKFLISKQLNRNPEEYRNTKGLGHVILALRHNSNPKKTRKLKSGDTVEYVICLDKTTESANQRAYTLEELNENPEFKIDVEYYLCQQVHPVVTRICDKLPITNAYTLAEMLGIEKSGLLHLKNEESDPTRKDQVIDTFAIFRMICSESEFESIK